MIFGCCCILVCAHLIITTTLGAPPPPPPFFPPPCHTASELIREYQPGATHVYGDFSCDNNPPDLLGDLPERPPSLFQHNQTRGGGDNFGFGYDRLWHEYDIAGLIGDPKMSIKGPGVEFRGPQGFVALGRAKNKLNDEKISPNVFSERLALACLPWASHRNTLHCLQVRELSG